MMQFKVFLVIVLILTSSFIIPATINGRFSIVQNSNNEFIVLGQINTNTGTDDLGGATIVFEFDSTTLSFPQYPTNGDDYIFHNFNNGSYSPATVTRPMANKIWVNIDLPYLNNNNGTLVAVSPSWTDVVTIKFDVLDPNGMASLTWLTTSAFWGIYDADNLTLWQSGQFENLFGPLPVELISFSGTLLPNDKVLLEWTTASSLNNSGFEIQKSYTESDDWEVIGFVENYGDPSSLIEYSFTDYLNHRSPTIRYRLKSIDYDGSYEYSKIIEISTEPVNYDLSQNYPNPFNPSTRIRYSIPSNVSGQMLKVTVKVYDILGNEVETLVDENKESGMYEVEFNAQGLASGTYIYRIIADSFVDTKKMILIR